jgi:predicted ester cyclase
MVGMSAERNKARVLELFERVLNGHDHAALREFTSNPAVLGSAGGLLQAFPDLRAEVQWIVAEGDMVVAFHSVRGSQQGPWLFVQEASGGAVETSFMLAFRFDDDGQIIDQWLGSNFVEMLAQIGWGFAPVGQVARPPGG